MIFLRSVISVFVALIITPAAAQMNPNHPAPLNIVLTNDDGYDSVGIKALEKALRATGHKVTVIAPATNQSGKSSSLTAALRIPFTKLADDVYVVEATPATCSLIAITAFPGLPLPDLIVSGINDGGNAAYVLPFSGTVGATIAAVNYKIPAIALSNSVPQFKDEEDEKAGKVNPAFVSSMAKAADFTVRLIQSLRIRNGDSLLPPRVALNVNFPDQPWEELKGVRVSTQGPETFTMTYKLNPGGNSFRSELEPIQFSQFPLDHDLKVMSERYISITPIDGDFTADLSHAAFDFLAELPELQP